MNPDMDMDISMAQCKTTSSPLLVYWRYCSLALNHHYIIGRLNTNQFSWCGPLIKPMTVLASGDDKAVYANWKSKLSPIKVFLWHISLGSSIAIELCCGHIWHCINIWSLCQNIEIPRKTSLKLYMLYSRCPYYWHKFIDIWVWISNIIHHFL